MSDKPKGSLAGQRFGNYIAYEVLGQGGMGTVYLAEHPDIGRKVAIKVISNTDSEELVRRFLEEAKAVNRIGHPNIIDVYDFGRTAGGRLYYVMEYLDGRELSAVMTEKRRMTPQEILPYLQQLCEAMQAAHDAGIIHRDLKPANIFVLDRHGPATMRVKVLDFGVAKLLDRPPGGFRTMPGMMLGTPMFSAPEQAAAELDKICPQTDLYSIGVMVYWMLSGRPPFMADNNAVLMAMHMTDPPPPIRNRAPNVPEGVAQIIEQCLAKKPQDRPASARALSQAFTEAAMGIKATGPVPAVGARASAAAAPAAISPPSKSPSPHDLSSLPTHAPSQPRRQGAVNIEVGDDYADESDAGSGVMVFVPMTPVAERAARAPGPHAPKANATSAVPKDVKPGDVSTVVAAEGHKISTAEFGAVEAVPASSTETPTAYGKPRARTPRKAEPQRGGAANSPDLSDALAPMNTPTLDPSPLLPPLPADELSDEDALEVTEVEIARDEVLSLVNMSEEASSAAAEAEANDKPEDGDIPPPVAISI